jgi:ubiquinone/menaquinone biosynthesis C-methylase UbiE
LRKSCCTCDYDLLSSNGAWLNRSLPIPKGFTDKQKNHLISIEQTHFWFDPRDRLLSNLALKKTCAKGNTLEVGCGSGRLLDNWTTYYNSIAAIEPHPGFVEIAGKRNTLATVVQAEATMLPFNDNSFDTVLTFDVLEHVDDFQMLKEAHRVTRKGGKLLLATPAFQSLWSYADELAGHNCRYNLKNLKSLLHKSGWRLLGHTYYQCALFPLLWLSRRVIKAQGRSLERSPSLLASKILGFVNTCEIHLSGLVPMPFGTSIIIWAEVK